MHLVVGRYPCMCRSAGMWLRGLLFRFQDRLLTPWGHGLSPISAEIEPLAQYRRWSNVIIVVSLCLEYTCETNVGMVAGRKQVCFIYLMHQRGLSSKTTATPHSAVGHIRTQFPSLPCPCFVSNCHLSNKTSVCWAQGLA
jgi:hypothetical protein